MWKRILHSAIALIIIAGALGAAWRTTVRSVPLWSDLSDQRITSVTDTIYVQEQGKEGIVVGVLTANLPSYHTNEYFAIADASGTGKWVRPIMPVLHGGTGATNASGARTALGLGTISTQDSDSVSISGGSIVGITDLAVADGGTGASDAATARANLGISGSGGMGTAALSELATLDGTLASEVWVTDTGQEGLFKWVADASAPDWVTDPDGTLTGIYYDESTTTDGVWYRAAVDTEPLNAKWFGAVGDGSTDNTTALQAWLDLAGSTTGAPSGENTWKAYLPRGKYKVTSSLEIVDGTQDQNNPIVIYGDNRVGSTLFANWTNGAPILTIVSNDFITVRDLGFIGGTAGSAYSSDNADFTEAVGLNLSHSDYSRLERLRFAGLSRGLVVDNPEGSFNTWNDLDFTQCGLGVNGYSVQAGFYSALRFNGCGAGGVIRQATGTQWSFACDAGGSITNNNAVLAMYAGNGISVTPTYFEGNDGAYSLSLGEEAVFYGTATISGTTVTFTPRAYNWILAGDTITVSSDSADSDIQNDVHGSRTVTAVSQTDGTITFEAASAAADGKGAGDEFNITIAAASTPLVRALSVGGGYNDDDTLGIYLGYVDGARVTYASNNPPGETDGITWTDDTTDLDLVFSGSPTTHIRKSLVFGPVVNLFKDPELLRGLDGMTIESQDADTLVTAESSPSVGAGKAIKLVMDETASPDGSGDVDAHFNLAGVGSELAEKDVWVGFSIYYDHVTAYRPTAGFSISNGGTGYGGLTTASATVGGRTVYFTITETGGVVDSITWKNGYAGSEDAGTLTLNEGNNDCTFTIGTYKQSSWGSNALGGYASVQVTLRRQDTTGVLYLPIYPTDTTTSVDKWIHYGFRATVPSGATEVRLRFRGINSGGCDGSEAFYIDNVTVTDVTGLPNPRTKANMLDVVTVDEWSETYPIIEQTLTETAGSIAVDFGTGETVYYCEFDEDSAFAAASNKAANKELSIILKNTDASSHTLTLNASWISYGEASPITVPAGDTVALALKCRGTAESDVYAAATLEN